MSVTKKKSNFLVYPFEFDVALTGNLFSLNLINLYRIYISS